MIGNKTVYWVAQLSGWLLYSFILLIYNSLAGEGINAIVIKSLLLITSLGLLVSHFYRFLIIRYNWLKLPLIRAVAVVLVASVLLGVLLHFLHGLLSDLLIRDISSAFERDINFHVQMVTNWILLLVLWSIFYFTTHYFANYKKEEIRFLKMLASQNEIELNNLKAQLNPHFMFNALNSIRALVDEDPGQAKTAITQLSSMLRGALQTGKRQLIAVEEELSLVKNYLAIEKIRFEERLKIEYDIDEDALPYNIPPLMLQTLVENAVKHGISSLTRGGLVVIRVKLEGEQLLVEVLNSGTYTPSTTGEGTGIGLKNTERRLGLLYGKEAVLEVSSNTETVKTKVTIPKNLTYENIDN